MDKKTLHVIYNQCLKQIETKEERQMLEEASRDPIWKSVILSWIGETYETDQYKLEMDEITRGQILHAIFQSSDQNAKVDEKVIYITDLQDKKPVKMRWWMAAAVFIGLLGLGLWMANLNTGETPKMAVNKGQSILPVRSGAQLTLSDGSIVPLKDIGDSILMKQGNVMITKSPDGSLVYTDNGESGDNGGINVLSTGKGQTFHIQLPDGSKLWLNAESSVSYRTDMNNLKERLLELKGEAYFEVKKQYIEDKVHLRKPFIVKSENQKVMVLGTEFNVNAFPGNGNIFTTLIEGSVKLQLKNQEATLIPGQQALNREGKLISVIEPNIAKVTAWKNGNFYFEEASIDEVATEIENWYDVTVVFNGEKTKETFSGMVSREKSLAEIIVMLEKTDAVHFVVNQKTIYISK